MEEDEFASPKRSDIEELFEGKKINNKQEIVNLIHRIFAEPGLMCIDFSDTISLVKKSNNFELLETNIYEIQKHKQKFINKNIIVLFEVNKELTLGEVEEIMQTVFNESKIKIPSAQYSEKYKNYEIHVIIGNIKNKNKIITTTKIKKQQLKQTIVETKKSINAKSIKDAMKTKEGARVNFTGKATLVWITVRNKYTAFEITDKTGSCIALMLSQKKDPLVLPSEVEKNAIFKFKTIHRSKEFFIIEEMRKISKSNNQNTMNKEFIKLVKRRNSHYFFKNPKQKTKNSVNTKKEKVAK